MISKVKCPHCGKYFEFNLSLEICDCPKCGWPVELSPKLRRSLEREQEYDWVDALNDIDTLFDD